MKSLFEQFGGTFYNSDENGLQPVGQMELVEKIIKSIPWGHNQRIMYKCKNITETLFYAQKTMDNGWSSYVFPSTEFGYPNSLVRGFYS